MALPAELIPRRYFDDYYDDFDDYASDEDDRNWCQNSQPQATKSILEAIHKRSVDCLASQIEITLKAGKSLDYDDSLNCVHLSEACSFGWVEGVELLLKHGANANVEKNLSTPLFSCCAMNSVSAHADCASLLLNYGADPNFQNHYGRKPLMAACLANAETVVDVLLSWPNVDIHARDPFGRTALFFAEETANTSIVEKLVKAGIDRRIKAYDGTIAENHRPEIVTELALTVDYCFSDLTAVDDSDYPRDDNQRIEEFLFEISNGFPSRVLAILNRDLPGANLLDILSFDEERLKRCGIKLSYHRREIINLLRSNYLLPWGSNDIPPQALQNNLCLKAIGDIASGALLQLIFMQGELNNLKQTIPTRTAEESQRNTLVQLVNFFVAQRNLKFALLKLRKELGNVRRGDQITDSKKSSWVLKLWDVVITSIAAPIRYLILKTRYD